jgi:tryptophan halogenase
MNIVIIGGGTAGWLTALYAKQIYNDKNIILVESEQYGILGAGEGTTPIFINFLNFLDILPSDLIKNCNATIKTGIKFTNWSNENDSYFHSFISTTKASNDYNFTLGNSFEETDTSFSHYCASIKNHNLKDYSFIEKLSYKSKVPYIFNDQTQQIEKLSSTALHFDAKLLANYLKKIGIERGIEIKEGIVEEIFNDVDGYINEIKIDKERIKCDFVFDCSGFKKLVIGSHYKSNWKSHSDHLPAKKAIPFFLKMDQDIPPYTESIAMNFGWMWKIPLQNRYGCGYVFDSDYISDSDAIKEIENYLGFEPEYPRKNKEPFVFSPGCFENIWIKNCLAVGLSSGFVEPLEATSIMQQILVLKRFMSNKQNLTIKNDFIKKRFNDLYIKETQQVVDFLYLHYVTNKKNNVFWENFTKNNKMTENIHYLLNIYKDKPLGVEFDFYNNTFFNLTSYYYLLIGNKILDNEILKNTSNYLLNDIKKQEYESILNEQIRIIPKCLTHNDFIDMLKK